MGYGTKEGGKKASRTILAKYGPDWYARMGALGGRAGHTGGFYGAPERARQAGRIGGSISRRGSEASGGSVAAGKSRDGKICNFCSEAGHTAYTCELRANVKRRKQIVVARQAYLDEQANDNRSKLSALAKKWAKR